MTQHYAATSSKSRTAVHASCAHSAHELFQQKSIEEHQALIAHRDKNCSLIREIALFNVTTLRPVYNHEKNTLPTQEVIDEEAEFYRLFEAQNWLKIKEKTRSLRLNRNESDIALRNMFFGESEQENTIYPISQNTSTSASSSQADLSSSSETEFFVPMRRLRN